MTAPGGFEEALVQLRPLALAGKVSDALAFLRDRGLFSLTRTQRRQLARYINDPDQHPIWSPQPGPQTQFMASTADIVFYGGAMGGGKTTALLLEAARHIFTSPGFNAVIFRRTLADIKKAGSLRDAAHKVYSLLPQAHFNQSEFQWTIGPFENTIGLAQLQYEHTVDDYRGSEICLMMFDELISFLESQFVFMMSRNRSMCDVRPYIRASTNPDRDSWVYDWVGPWVDYNCPIYPTPSAHLRYLRRFEDTIPPDVLPFVVYDDPHSPLVWVTKDAPKAKSFTYIPSTVYDNPALLARDDTYVASLEAQTAVNIARNLRGDWNAVEFAGGMFKESWFQILPEDEPLPQVQRWIRWWDLAGTDPEDLGNRKARSAKADWSVGARWGVIGTDTEGRNVYLLAHVNRFQGTWARVSQEIEATAVSDGRDTLVYVEQEPGSAGKSLIRVIAALLKGKARVTGVPSTGDKITRARPAAAAAEQHRIFLAPGPWNDTWIAEHGKFPPKTTTGFDDQVDTTSGFLGLYETKGGNKPRPRAGRATR